MAHVPIIYAGPSPSTPKKKPQTYQSVTVPYYSLHITYNLYAANQVTFDSPTYYEDMSKIHIVGKNKPFGGQIFETKETPTGHEYNCLDYTRLLFGKWPFNKKNVRVSDVIKETVAYVGMPTSGIMKTSVVHKTLAAPNQKRIDTCQQMANLEGLEFHVNQDGIPILRDQPEATAGYIFFTQESTSDYSVDYNDSDLVDSVYVLGENNVLLYKYADQSMIVKYGYLEDFITDSSISDEGDAITQAEALFKQSNDPRYAGTLSVPDVLPIGEGEWMVFVPPKWSKETINAFYTKQVDITIDSNTCDTQIQFLDSQPAPPDEWIYTDPTTNEQVPTFNAVASGDMIYTYRPVWICSDNIYGRGADQSHINTIIAGLRKLGIKCHSGGIGPNTHDNIISSTSSNALIVEIYGGADAGVIYEKTTAWWKGLLSKRKDALVFMSSAERITGLSFLPRAHDDNYDPSSFKGISHPDKVLHDNGIQYIEGVNPGSLGSVITFIQQQAILTATRATPKLPAVLNGVPTNLTSLCQIYTWIDQKINYSFYWYPQKVKGDAKVLSSRSANCYDQAHLAKTWLTALGYKCKIVHTYCGTLGHCHLMVYVNNEWVVFDTTCHKESQIHDC